MNVARRSGNLENWPENSPDEALAPQAHPEQSASTDASWDPLHPMHQELVRRLAPEPETGLIPIPARFAIITYLGLASWGLVWIVAHFLI